MAGCIICARYNRIPMETYIDYAPLGKAFWKKYVLLWQNSIGRSPFQSPSILQYFSESNKGDVVAFQCIRDGNLIAAALLKKAKGVYTFLSDMKTDANFFVLHNQCSQEEIWTIFEQFLQVAGQNNWTLMLNYQPCWASYMSIFEKTGKVSGLYWQNIRYSVCPVTDDEPAGALFNRINGLRAFRYPVSRLKNQEKAIFEVFTDHTDLECWADEFCEAHIRRWADTPTPSAYSDPDRRQFLKNCLYAWAADSILIRFSVKAPMGRVGFVIGLLEENSLVFHATTFHPEYKKFSPGKALIYAVAEWMARQNIQVLDFGDGNEPYKYDVADRERQLNRIFISHPLNFPFILKTKTIKVVRGNSKMYIFYRDKIKRLIQRAKFSLLI